MLFSHLAEPLLFLGVLPSIMIYKSDSRATRSRGRSVEHKPNAFVPYANAEFGKKLSPLSAHSNRNLSTPFNWKRPFVDGRI